MFIECDDKELLGVNGGSITLFLAAVAVGLVIGQQLGERHRRDNSFLW